VKFQDGTPFDAAAVCFNFDRWFNMKGAAAQSQMIYYGTSSRASRTTRATPTGQPLYKDCQAPDPNTAVLHLNRFKGRSRPRSV